MFGKAAGAFPALPPYDAQTQADIEETLVKSLVVQNFLPLSIFETAGMEHLFGALLPRARLPNHQAVARILDRLEEDQWAHIRASVAKISDLGFPAAVSEVDCWPAPTGENYFGVILHGITAKFEPVHILLYADVLGTAETAANQAQRLIYVFSCHLNADDLVSRPLRVVCGQSCVLPPRGHCPQCS